MKIVKEIEWIGSSLDDIRSFPEGAKKETGYQLRRVQNGLEPTDWKPMPSVGPGVMEIRIHQGGEHRVFYVAKFEEGVFVLHAFSKKTQKTSKLDIELGKRRYREALKSRKE